MAAPVDAAGAAPVGNEAAVADVTAVAGAAPSTGTDAAPTAAVEATASTETDAAPAAITQDDPEVVEEFSALEVPESLVGWLVGPGAEHVIELERLSNARIEVSRNPATEGKREVFLRGTSVAVARARVLLEEKLRSNAPTSGSGASSSAREEKAHTNGGEVQALTEEEGRPMIMVAGRSFKDRDQLVSHIRALQSSITDGAMLGPEDAFFIFHLITYHPNFVEKMTAPVAGFKYGPHESFAGSKCFFVVRVDGSEEGISIMKCVDSLAPKRGRNEPRNDGEARGTKRAREEDPAEDGAGPVPPAKFKREIQSGCVLVIDGVPADFGYEELRELLNEYGSVRFLELLRPKEANETAPDADVAADEGGKEKAPEAAENTTEVRGPAPAETSAADGRQDGPAKAASEAEASASCASGGSLEQQVSGADRRGPAQSGEAATSAGTSSASGTRERAEGDPELKVKAEGKADAADHEGEDVEMAKQEAKEAREAEEVNEAKEAKEQPGRSSSAPATARARFSEAEGATRAAAELRELDGTPVTLRILRGEEEREFWERLWQKADAAKQGKGGKGKGKDGKGKGKGKGKGGKSKGDGKGKGKKSKAW
mmetsp:Transcript_85322/g.198364  ORF Transcript_85322/g.198364 Transcript_85322/m.198364 type:complete len:601 (-) Transcript_85322:363-2165(-)